jgi:hypothetical protein
MAGGAFDVITATTTTERKIAAAVIENIPFEWFAFGDFMSPTRVAFIAHGLPCLSLDRE